MIRYKRYNAGSRTRKQRGLVHPDSELDAKLATDSTPSTTPLRGIPAVNGSRPRASERWTAYDVVADHHKKRRHATSDCTVTKADGTTYVITATRTNERAPRKHEMTDAELTILDRAAKLHERRAKLSTQKDFD
jgi:hypothetical protein